MVIFIQKLKTSTCNFIFIFISQPRSSLRGSDCNYSCIKLGAFIIWNSLYFSPTYFSILTFHYKFVVTLLLWVYSSLYIILLTQWFYFIFYLEVHLTFLQYFWPQTWPSFKVQFQHHLSSNCHWLCCAVFSNLSLLVHPEKYLKALVSFSSSSSLCSSFTDIWSSYKEEVPL